MPSRRRSVTGRNRRNGQPRRSDADEERESGEERPGAGRGRRAAASADGNNVKANYTKYEYMIPMRDGVRLHHCRLRAQGHVGKVSVPDGPHAV